MPMLVWASGRTRPVFLLDGFEFLLGLGEGGGLLGELLLEEAVVQLGLGVEHLFALMLSRPSR